jgi:hypothetical protein
MCLAEWYKSNSFAGLLTANYENPFLRERVCHAGSGPARTRWSITPPIEHLTNVHMHCEIVSVREDDIGAARRLVAEALRCLGAFRQTVLILEFRANKKERPAVAPDPRGREE